MINVTASLTTKKNNYYVVTYYRDIFNKIQRKTHRTGIKAIKGNKKIAERKKEEIRSEYEKEINATATLSSIDFESKSIIIRHTVSQTKINGKLQIIAKDKTKNKSSYRSLPLIPEIEEILLDVKKNQSEDKKSFKNEYKNKEGYICVNTDGSILKPDYVSHKFHEILKENNLRSLRFHDLRHSCASLLLHNNIQMKDIQIWLGHSSYNTTADLYAHVDITSKDNSANVISNVLSVI